MKYREKDKQHQQQGVHAEGALAGRLVVLLSAAGGAYWRLATCPFLEPFPSIGGGAHRPLTPLCPPSPCLAYPYLPTHASFLLGGCANGAEGGSMVGNNRPNVPAIDTSSHQVGASCTAKCVPFLVGLERRGGGGLGVTTLTVCGREAISMCHALINARGHIYLMIRASACYSHGVHWRRL